MTIRHPIDRAAGRCSQLTISRRGYNNIDVSVVIAKSVFQVHVVT